MANSGYRDGLNQGASLSAQGKDRDFRPGSVKSFVKSVVSETYRKNFSEGVRAGYDLDKMKGT